MYWALYGYRRSSIYKQWRLDIWGLYRSRKYKRDRVANFFANMDAVKIANLRIKTARLLYRMYETPLILQPRKFLPKQLFLLRLNLFFYFTLSPNYFRKLINKAHGKIGSFKQNYYLLLEGRLMSFLYRANLISNVFMLRFWVRFGAFTVNGRVTNKQNMFLKIFDIVSVKTEFFATLLLLDLAFRVHNGVLYFNTPRHIYLNLRLLYACMRRKPIETDLAFPIKRIDMFKGGDYIRKFK